MLAAVTKNLGELAFEQQRYDEAEEYFDGLDQLAAHMLQPETKAAALEWRGLSLEQLGRDHEAAEVWESAATLCRNIGMPALLRVNLEHLERVYHRTNRPGALRDVQERACRASTRAHRLMDYPPAPRPAAARHAQPTRSTRSRRASAPSWRRPCSRSSC